MKFQAPKGTHDILPGEVERWQWLEERTRQILALYGYREVRSPIFESTEAYDRGDKFESYQRVPTLKEYVLVSHREPLIEVFRRTDAGTWLRSEARTKARVRLELIGCELEVDRVYEGINLAEP